MASWDSHPSEHRALGRDRFLMPSLRTLDDIAYVVFRGCGVVRFECHRLEDFHCDDFRPPLGCASLD